jgi:DNA-binding MarR family transcriptional regulator
MSPGASRTGRATSSRDDAAELLSRLSQVTRRAEQRLATVLAECGVHSWEFDVLRTLRSDGPPYEMCPGTIGGRLEVSNSAMTNRINRLEQSGHVERHYTPDNRRITIIRLTEQGKRTVDAALEASRRDQEELIGTLPAKDRAQLSALLDKLDDAVSQH